VEALNSTITKIASQGKQRTLRVHHQTLTARKCDLLIHSKQRVWSCSGKGKADAKTQQKNEIAKMGQQPWPNRIV